MVGYVVVNKPELKFKEFDIYRSFYCGLCDQLKDVYGAKGQISISYDMTFLVMLLTGLYEPKTSYYRGRCVAHPLCRHPVRRNKMTEYVADMNVLLTYYNCMDDWNDERKWTRRAFAGVLSKKVRQIEKKYPNKSRVIKEALEKLSVLEHAGETNMDEAAKQFGKIMAVIFAVKDDIWSETLSCMGDALGRFVYLMDAYEDMDKDIKKGSYNVLLYHRDSSHFDAFIENILQSYMAECARNFERLPIIKNANILRNIIYSGVWTRYNHLQQVKEKREQKRAPVSHNERKHRT